MNRPDGEQAKVSRRELRKFGWVVGGVFGLLFGLLLPWVWRRPFPAWPWYIAAPLFFFALFLPSWLRVPQRLWSRLGEGLHWVNSRILLSALFFLVFTPISRLLKLLGRDPLARSLDGETETYRTIRSEAAPLRMERPY